MSRQALRKKVKKEAQSLLKSLLEPEMAEENDHGLENNNNQTNASELNIEDVCANSNYSAEENLCDHPINSADTTKINSEIEEHRSEDLRSFLSLWSIKYSIPVQAMNELLDKFNKLDNSLP